MPNINEGLSYGGDPGRMDAESARALEQIRHQTAMSKTVRGEGPMSDDELRAGILGAGAATDWRSNLTTGDPDEQAREQAQIDRFSREGEALIAREEADRRELDGYRRQSVVENAQDLLMGGNAQDGEEFWQARALGWGMLRLDERAQAVEEGFVEEHEVPLLDQLALRAAGLIEDAAHLDSALEAKQQDDQAKGAVYARLVAETGFSLGSPEEIAWRTDIADRAARRGVDLNVVSAKDFERIVRFEDANIESEQRAHAVARSKAELLGEPTADIMSGLTVLQNGHHVPVQPVPEIHVRPDRLHSTARDFGGALDDPISIKHAVSSVEPAKREYDKLMAQATEMFGKAAQARREAAAQLRR